MQAEIPQTSPPVPPTTGRNIVKSATTADTAISPKTRLCRVTPRRSRDSSSTARRRRSSCVGRTIERAASGANRRLETSLTIAKSMSAYCVGRSATPKAKSSQACSRSRRSRVRIHHARGFIQWTRQTHRTQRSTNASRRPTCDSSCARTSRNFSAGQVNARSGRKTTGRNRPQVMGTNRADDEINATGRRIPIPPAVVLSNCTAGPPTSRSDARRKMASLRRHQINRVTPTKMPTSHVAKTIAASWPARMLRDAVEGNVSSPGDSAAKARPDGFAAAESWSSDVVMRSSGSPRSRTVC